MNYEIEYITDTEPYDWYSLFDGRKFYRIIMDKGVVQSVKTYYGDNVDDDELKKELIKALNKWLKEN